MRIFAVAAAVGLLPVAAQAADGLATRPVPAPITGGEPVGPCGWPSAVWMQGCSGTLIDPQYVVYAAHCNPPTEAFFGEDANAPGGRRVPVEECWRYPNGRPGDGTDFGLCRLAFAVDDVPIVPPLMGCEADVLSEGQPVTVVGYGLTPEGDFGRKYAVTTVLNGFNDVGEASIGGDGEDSCQGDSGGPVFVELPDGGGWRFFGVTSYGPADCTSGGFYAQVAAGMSWFEEVAGRDLTPCTDATGAWSPDPRCANAPLGPAQGSGAWESSCGEGAVTGLVSTCGDPFAEPPDLAAPVVAIADPLSGSEYDTQVITGVAMVDIAVEADDEGWGVRWVELHADGEPLPNAADFGAPFTFALPFEPGVYELTAVATDYADNVTVSDPIWIGVDETPPSIPSPPNPGMIGCGCTSGETGWIAALLLGLLLPFRRRG